MESRGPRRPAPALQRNALNLLVDVLTLAVMLALAATGVMMKYVLPPGTSGRHGGEARILWGMDRHDLGSVHWALSLALAAVVLIHVALHWTWVCTSVRRWLGRTVTAGRTPAWARNLYGLGFLTATAAGVAGFVWVASASVEIVHLPGPRGPQQTHHEDASGTLMIRGSTTLGDIAAMTGKPVDVVRERLGIPASVPSDDRLGRVARRYGFDVSTARQALSDTGERNRSPMHAKRHGG